MKTPKPCICALNLLLLLIPAAWAQTLGTTNLLEGNLAGSDSVVLSVTPAGAAWTAATSNSWLHLSCGNQSGAGSTNVVFTLDANLGATRTGTITIAGQTLTVIQAGSTYIAANQVFTVMSLGFNFPYSVVLDRAGNIYVPSSYYKTIYKWIQASNTVTTLLSSGLSYPDGLDMDGAGNLYIADGGDNTVKEWSAASHILTTLVSTGLSFPEAVALDGSGNVYIADYGDNAVKEWSAASQTLITLVPGLKGPAGVAVDSIGNIYIADSGNNAVKEWSVASHALTTLVGSGLNMPTGVAADGSGNVYIADQDDAAVKKWTAVSNSVTTLVFSEWNSNLHDVTVDGAGNIYFTGNSTIEELPHAYVDSTAKSETPFAGSDMLPVVLPTTANLTGPFAPTSDADWLTITGITNGVVSFGFTPNASGSMRTANIKLLGQTIPVTQMAPVLSLSATNFVQGPAADCGSVALSVTPANYPWTATANASWLHLDAANQSGVGSTNVIFTFDTNPGTTRTGTITIAGQTLAVTQAGSTYVVATPVVLSSGLDLPNGVAVERSGNVFIADTYHSVIKEWLVTSYDTVTLVASGLAQPNGVAVDNSGNVYISDTWNRAIRKWTPVSNTLVTLVSSGLSYPTGVAVDSGGNIYIADMGNNTIKKWTAASNTVSTLVSSGLNYPNGVAVDRAGNVYIADSLNNAVKKWAAADHTLSVVVSSGLNYPSGVAVDSEGNVYIADDGNNTIKEWKLANSNVTTLVSGQLSQGYPIGIAVDNLGNLYFPGQGDYAVEALPHAFLDPTAKSESPFAGSDALPAVLPPTANLTGPFAPTSDADWLTVTGTANGVVSFVFSANTSGSIRTANITLLGRTIPVAQTTANFTLSTTNLLEGPLAGSDTVVLSVTPSNFPWTATTDTTWLHFSAAYERGVGSAHVVFTFDANPGATRAGTLTIAGQTLTVTQAGVSYVAASPVTLASSALSFPTGVAVDSEGNVYFSEAGTKRIKEWMVASNTITTLVSSGLNTPTGVAVDGSGNVYIVDTGSAGNSAIYKWTKATRAVTTLVSCGLDYPHGVAVDAAGNVYIAAEDNQAILKWTAANSNVTALVSSGLYYPAGVAVDASGNVYIGDQLNNAVKEWSVANSNVTTLVSSGLDYPIGVAVDGVGNVYIADSGNDAIKEWSVANSNVTTLASSGLYNPQGVAVDGAGNVYIAATHNNAIEELPHAFVDPTAKTETAAAGSDALPVVLPATANLTGPFAPTSDADWLTVTGITYGVVSFAFTANTLGSIRTANITLLGRTIPIAQMPPTISLGTTNLLEGPMAGSDSVALSITPASSPWAAMANAAWLHLDLANQSGLGSTNVIFVFDINTGTTRTGTITIAGRTLTVTQAGCTYVAASQVATLVSSGLLDPEGVAVDHSGNVYIADSGNQAIKEWTVANNTVATLVASGLVYPSGVAVDGERNVYISDTFHSAIKEWVAASDTVATLVSSNLSLPFGVAVDGLGNVYIADTYNNSVKKWVATNNTVTTIAASGLSLPFGVAVDAAGNVYIADTLNSAIEEWVAADDIVTPLVDRGLAQPRRVAVDGGGNVYIADPPNNVVKEWMAASGAVIALASTGLNYPWAVTVDRAGNVYIADTGNNAIKELPHAFVDPTAKVEPATAGSDALPVVLPATANLTGPFAPASDSAWLTITGNPNGVVTFSFAANPLAISRTANITVLGQTVSVTQSAASVTPPTITGITVLSNGAFQLSFTNNQGAAFTVLTTTNLLLPLSDWTVLGGPAHRGFGQYQFTDLTATNRGQRFYRVSAP
jgi:DNA-binding beta-propeller fold protein YncE